MRLNEAADRLGVHYQTAYAWVRNGQLPARKVRRGYEVSEADVTALAQQRAAGRAPAAQIMVRDWAAQADRLYDAIVDGQETQARRAVERLTGHISITDLCDRVIAPALRKVGSGWQAGTISIAREHRAAAICERLIGTHATASAGRPRGVAVVATPPGERHGLPALMAAACLRENHWQVHHLAADLPAAEISALAAHVGADLVVLSTTGHDAATAAGHVAESVHAAAPAATVLIGHPGQNLASLAASARDLNGTPGPRA